MILQRQRLSTWIALFSFFGGLLPLLPLGAQVQKRVGIDVVLVIDASKSMKTNDPQDLRKVGAKEFIDLCPQPW